MCICALASRFCSLRATKRARASKQSAKPANQPPRAPTIWADAECARAFCGLCRLLLFGHTRLRCLTVSQEVPVDCLPVCWQTSQQTTSCQQSHRGAQYNTMSVQYQHQFLLDFGQSHELNVLVDRRTEANSGGGAGNTAATQKESTQNIIASPRLQHQPAMINDRLLDIACKVCGDRSSGKHYGLYSCDGKCVDCAICVECLNKLTSSYRNQAVRASSNAAFTAIGDTYARRKVHVSTPNQVCDLLS